MTAARTYSSPEAFKQSLEQRIRSSVKAGRGLARQRQLLVFDRFLARVVATLGDAVTLKGGLVVELRLDRARTTKDVDLRLTGSPDDLLARLQRAGGLDLGDFLFFEVAAHADHPEIQAEGMAYDGLRFQAECRLAGKPYGDPFGVDVVVGEPMVDAPDLVTADDVLGFAGIAPPTLRLYPVETHIAEKLHAYTVPRLRPNSRVKDLPDIVLLAGAKVIEASKLRAALEQTFAFRKTHELPMSLPSAPETWERPYAAMARADGLVWPTLAEVASAAKAFLDPVLDGTARGSWNGTSWGFSP